MQTNNHFNFNRFTLLLKQDLLINRTKYLLGILGLGVITYLLCYLFLTTSKINFIGNYKNIYGYYSVCFVFYMMVVGVVIGTAFPDLSDKIKTSHFLLSPGSTLEKLMVQFMLRIGLFVPIALGLFWIAIQLAKASLKSEILYGKEFFDSGLLPEFEYIHLFTGVNRTLDPWFVLFTISGLFSYGVYLFAGATYFKRYALIKTVIASAVVLGISILFMMMLSNIFYTQNRFFEIKLQSFRVTENLDSDHLFAIILSLFSWVFFMSIAYFNLKEKEV